jgi:cell division protein FtsW
MLSWIGAPQLLLAGSLLASFGLVMVYSASAIRSELLFGSSSVYFVRQLSGLGLGVCVAALLAHVRLDLLRRFGLAAWAVCVLLVAATLTPLGVGRNGADRWLDVAGIVFQPLELMKLGLVLGLSQWLANHERSLDEFRFSVAGPALLTAVPAVLLLLQPDFGGALMLALFAAAIVFAAGAPLKHLAVSTAVALPAAFWIATLAGYRVLRLETFLDPWSDRTGNGYQLVQSLLAFGAGGLTGTGLGSGQQKLGYLPEAHTDFILSVVGEELGLIGVWAVLICSAVLGMAALGIAARGRDPFAMLVAFGASLMLWLQTLLNAAVAMALLPTKGTTLPLFSYGRSSLIASLAAVGLILNVARPSRRGRVGWR